MMLSARAPGRAVTDAEIAKEHTGDWRSRDKVTAWAVHVMAYLEAFRPNSSAERRPRERDQGRLLHRWTVEVFPAIRRSAGSRLGQGQRRRDDPFAAGSRRGQTGVSEDLEHGGMSHPAIARDQSHSAQVAMVIR